MVTLSEDHLKRGVIKDPVHKNVKVSNFEFALMDTLEFQRLRRVRQLAMAYLTYPGAQHTRFEHSYGTMHLAGRFAEKVGCNRSETKVLRAAALLHDVGHTAFSHEAEDIVYEKIGLTHEEAGWEIIRTGSLRDVLTANGIAISEFKDAYFGKGAGELVSFELGADRMDYLLRDSHFTGVAYGVTDSERIIHTVKRGDGGLLLERGGLEAAESLLIARFLMLYSVYYHHAVRIANGVLKKALWHGIEDGVLTVADLLKRGDEYALLKLEESREARPLVERIMRRDLFKRALERKLGGFSSEGIALLASRRGVMKLEHEIADGAGVAPDELLVSYPPEFLMKWGNLRVENDGELCTLEDLSELISAIERTGESRRSVLVASAKEHKGKVARAAERVFASLELNE